MNKTQSPTLRIGTLMLAIAIIAIILALVKGFPILAIALVIPSSIGLAVSLSTAEGRAGDKPTIWDYLIAFLNATAFVCVVCVGIVSALLITCALP